MTDIPTIEETRKQTDNGWIARAQEQLAEMIRSAEPGQRSVEIDVAYRNHSVREAREVLEPFAALGYCTHLNARCCTLSVKW